MRNLPSPGGHKKVEVHARSLKLQRAPTGVDALVLLETRQVFAAAAEHKLEVRQVILRSALRQKPTLVSRVTRPRSVSDGHRFQPRSMRLFAGQQLQAFHADLALDQFLEAIDKALNMWGLHVLVECRLG